MAAALAVLAFVAAGCGGTREAPTTASVAAAPAPSSGLRVGVVGPLSVRVPGAVAVHGPLRGMRPYRLVVVSAAAVDVAEVETAAAAHPTAHYAIVGSRTRGHRRPNLAGVVLRDEEAAFLGGIVSALVAVEEGGGHERIAWASPGDAALAAAYARGAHSVEDGIVILQVGAGATPAACKESALRATERGAVVVMAREGRCGDAAVAGAHQQNRVGLRIADFELPSVAAAQIVRDAVAGVYHGDEDLVFGAASGAIGINRLDPRIGAATAVAARTAAQDIASGRRAAR